MTNKFLRALLSVVIAVVLWALVVSSVSTKSDMSFAAIPVMMQGEEMLLEDGLMVTNMDVSAVNLRLEGTRKDLNNLSAADIKVTVDVSRRPVAGTHEMTYSVSIADESDFSVLSKEPSRVRVTLEPRISKRIPVDVQITGNVASNFMADKENMTLDTSEVTVTGPQSEVDQIASARVDVDIEGRNESLSQQYEYTLCNAQGEPVSVSLVTTDINQVNLSLKITRVKEIVLFAKIISGGGATEENTTITINPETVWVSGSDNLLEGLEKLELGTINLGELSEDQTLNFPIKLPEGITDETGVSEATVNVSFGDLATKTLTVKNITVVNLPAGLKADLLTKALEIQIRGPKDKLDAVTEETVMVSVDFSGTELGAVKMKAAISFDDPDFGVIGSYTVSATVSELTS